jgi:hypothetical protein
MGSNPAPWLAALHCSPFSGGGGSDGKVTTPSHERLDREDASLGRLPDGVPINQASEVSNHHPSPEVIPDAHYQ